MNCVFLFVFFLLDWLPPIPRQFLTSSREWPACQVTILCDSGVPVSTPLFHIKKTLLYETLLPKQTTRGLLHALRLKTVQVIYCSLCSKSVDGKGGGVWLKKIVTYIFFNLFLFSHTIREHLSFFGHFTNWNISARPICHQTHCRYIRDSLRLW